MKLKTLLLSLIILLGFALGSQAQTATPSVVKSQKNQQKRIHKGVKSGEITKKEYVRLKGQQQAVQQHKRAAKADGVVTRRERRQLNLHQKKASKAIYIQKNDKQKRY